MDRINCIVAINKRVIARDETSASLDNILSCAFTIKMDDEAHYYIFDQMQLPHFINLVAQINKLDDDQFAMIAQTLGKDNHFFIYGSPDHYNLGTRTAITYPLGQI